MALLDFQNFAFDSNVRPFIRDFRSDLLASDIELQAAGVYFIFKHKVPKGQMLVVKALVPYAMERTAPGTTYESAAMLDPQVASGQFAFEPQINGNAPFLSSINYNAMRAASGTLTNTDRVVRKGFSIISNTPLDDAKKEWYNPMFSFLVPSDATLSVTFSILPVGTASPIPSPYTIGVTAVRRVDFAGVVLAGLEIPEQIYHKLAQDAKAKG